MINLFRKEKNVDGTWIGSNWNIYRNLGRVFIFTTSQMQPCRSQEDPSWVPAGSLDAMRFPLNDAMNLAPPCNAPKYHVWKAVVMLYLYTRRSCDHFTLSFPIAARHFHCVICYMLCLWVCVQWAYFTEHTFSEAVVIINNSWNSAIILRD